MLQDHNGRSWTISQGQNPPKSVSVPPGMVKECTELLMCGQRRQKGYKMEKVVPLYILYTTSRLRLTKLFFL